jgi:hypothetical protein
MKRATTTQMETKKMESLKAWTITQLKLAMDRDLEACHTETERLNVEAICGREIRDLASSLTRKLTPGELSILTNLK